MPTSSLFYSRRMKNTPSSASAHHCILNCYVSYIHICDRPCWMLAVFSDYRRRFFSCMFLIWRLRNYFAVCYGVIYIRALINWLNYLWSLYTRSTCMYCIASARSNFTSGTEDDDLRSIPTFQFPKFSSLSLSWVRFQSAVYFWVLFFFFFQLK